MTRKVRKALLVAAKSLDLMQNLLTIRVQILELFLNFHLESKRFVSIQVVDGGHEAFIINICERALLLNTEFSDKNQS